MYRLNDIQIDALNEIINIGAGNAATSLSIMINEKINMSIPRVLIKSVEEIASEEEEEEVVAVMVKTVGDIPAGAVFVFTKKVALKLINILTSNNTNEINELGKSVISEIGNIVIGSFVNAMATFTEVNLQVSIPAISNDINRAIIISSFVENGQYDDFALEIKIKFASAKKNGIEGKFYFIPEPESIKTILKLLHSN